MVEKFFHIVIPTFNLEDWISDCLNSILSQTFSDFGITVVDDCSTDRTKKILDDYAQKYPNAIEFIPLDQKGYSGTARNVGISKTRFSSKYTMFIDGDDGLYNNENLASIYTAISAENVDAVFYNSINPQSNNVTKLKPVNLHKKDFHYCAHIHYVVKTEIVQPYLDGCSYGEDVYHNFLQLNAISTYCQLSDIVYVRNSRKESLTHSKTIDSYLFRLRQIPILFDALDRLIDENAISNQYVRSFLIERASHREAHLRNTLEEISKLSSC